MNETAMPSILWIGRSEPAEFAEARSALGRLTRVVECRTFAEASALDPADDAALIVVAEAVPGEHSPDGYAAIRRLRPAIPIVRIYGCLCEGELRTNPPPPAIRLSWLNAAATLGDDWRRLARGECPSWGRPAAGDDERLPVGASADFKLPPSLKNVGLLVRDPATAAWLSDFLRRCGVTAVRLGREIASEPRAVEAILWDRPLSTALQEADLAELRRAYPQTPFVALAGFPRLDEIRKLELRGAGVVLGKPLVPGELTAALHRVLEINRVAG